MALGKHFATGLSNSENIFPETFCLRKKGKGIGKCTFAMSGLYEGMTSWTVMGSEGGKVQGGDWSHGPWGVWKEDLSICFS